MKTLKDYLMELPPDVYDLAINNTYEGRLGLYPEDFAAALLGAFLWTTSKEGQGYWETVFEKHLGVSVVDYSLKSHTS